VAGCRAARLREWAWCYLYLFPFLVFFAGFTIWPFVASVGWSFTDRGANRDVNFIGKQLSRTFRNRSSSAASS